MKKILRLGDPHAKRNNLEESERLLSFVEQKAIELGVDRIEILGDLFHTHAELNLFVLEFWDRWLDRLSAICETIVLVGNHDQSGNYNSVHNSLAVFKRINRDNLKIVENTRMEGVYGYVAYVHDKERFITLANSLAESGATVLVCHQTIQGSKFDNGMYAPEGIDSTRISEKFIHIISGHIHGEQEFGRVIYPGTARWDTASDANKRKGIWLYTHDDAGTITNREFISTESVCVPIWGYEWKEGTDKPVIPDGYKATIELIGSSNWINSVKSDLKMKYSIKTNITDSKRIEKRETGKDLGYFVKNLFTTSLNKERLLRFMKELEIV